MRTDAEIEAAAQRVLALGIPLMTIENARTVVLAAADALAREKMIAAAPLSPAPPAPSTPADGWRPIESAPKDVLLLLYAPPEKLYVDTHGKRGAIRVSSTRNWTWATHWRPLPAPPEE